jgi:ribosomal protein L3
MASYTSFEKCLKLAEEKAKKMFGKYEVERRVRGEVEKCWIVAPRHVVLVMGVVGGKRKCLAVLRKAK